MRVYKVVADVEAFRSVYPADKAMWRNKLLFDGMPKLSGWPTPEFYYLYPKLSRGEFFGGITGGLVVSPEAVEAVRTFFEMAGELLPIKVEGEPEEFILLNVTECTNSLNKRLTEWSKNPETGEDVLIKKYVFHPNRFVDSTIFKIPETCTAQTLVVERYNDPECEFKAFVEQSGLRGLIFEELWRSDNK